jgi:hypothetical protein
MALRQRCHTRDRLRPSRILLSKMIIGSRWPFAAMSPARAAAPRQSTIELRMRAGDGRLRANETNCSETLLRHNEWQSRVVSQFEFSTSGHVLPALPCTGRGHGHGLPDLSLRHHSAWRRLCPSRIACSVHWQPYPWRNACTVGWRRGRSVFMPAARPLAVRLNAGF